MNNERWSRLNELFDAAVALSPAERAAFLRSTCSDEPELRAELERLLRAHDRIDPRLDSPATLVHALLASDDTLVAAGQRLGPYRIVREIARGGMGTVYLAERADGNYEQRVALKLVAHGLHNDVLRRRFLSERQILASLDHPNIARLLDGGTSDDGYPYLVMEFIEGEPINLYVQRTGLPLRERLQLFLQVCDAVAYAHSRQVIHRDLKPGNILVTAQGIPKLVDFGIAKILEPSGQDGSAVTGIRILTPDYASPEQIDGRTAAEASDVYSLGVVLYELLTGRLPHAPADSQPPGSPAELRTTQPPRPSTTASSAPTARELRGDLDVIALCALRAEPERRYASANAFADDIRRYLRSEPIRARPDTIGYRAVKFVRRNRTALAAAGITAVLSTAALAALVTLNPRTRSASSPPGAAPVMAVAPIIDNSADPRVHVGPILGDMLAINLARVPGIGVVSTARMYELMALSDSGARPASAARAALRAGASELLRGTVNHGANSLRLDLERIDIASGAVRDRYQVEGGTLFELVDRATADIARHLGAPALPLRVQDVTTSNVIAYRFFEEGLRSFAVADFRTAKRLFEAAFAEDSTFAMALHYVLVSRITLHEDVSRSERRKLQQLATRATDRERLLIRAMLLTISDEPGLAAVAETLATRYPTEPDGHYWVGIARVNAGDFASGIPYLYRVVAMDSLGLSGKQARCRACDALAAITNAYLAADSPRAAERVARHWLRVQPRSARPLFALGSSFEMQGRNVEALGLYRRAVTLSPGQPFDALFPAMFRIRAGDFANADAALRDLALNGSEEESKDALWFLIISLRNQGRLHDAMTTASELQRKAPRESTAAAQQRAQILFEMGRHASAAALFDSIANVTNFPDYSAPHLARHRVWNLTHLANVLAALEDTARLKVIIDTLSVWGKRSAFPRDWRLHHHARGLLLAARGQLQPAHRELQRAIYYPTAGYTRTNLELARVLLAQGRAAEAIPVLRAALRGPLDASNLYVTRTELHELLGQAWQAAGEPDSARVEYQRVLRAWQRADAGFAPRVENVRTRLATLSN